jgi:hypothetical protein
LKKGRERIHVVERAESFLEEMNYDVFEAERRPLLRVGEAEP